MYATIISLLFKAKEIIIPIIVKYWYVFVILIAMLGCYCVGYHNGSKIADDKLAEQARDFSQQIETSRERIKDLEEDNRRLTTALSEASKSVDRATEYTESAIGGIEGVVQEMRQYTETK